MPGPGRPSKFTPETAAAIVESLRQGALRRAAAEAHGVSYATLRRWLRNGRQYPEGDYGRFADRVRQAEAEIENDCARRVAIENPEWYLIHARAAEWAIKRELRELVKTVKALKAQLHGRASGRPDPVDEGADRGGEG